MLIKTDLKVELLLLDRWTTYDCESANCGKKADFQMIVVTYTNIERNLGYFCMKHIPKDIHYKLEDFFNRGYN